MKKQRKIQRSPLAVAVLALLAEEPMHPYRMQQLIKERGKDEVVNVRQRTSIYQTIERLLRDGLIAVRETSKEAGRPDRTVYEATPQGQLILREWLRDILSTPQDEFPEFPVGLSFLPILQFGDVQQQFRKRIVAIEEEVRRIDSILQTYGAVIPRIFLLESEYKRAVISAELDWVRAVFDDFQSGELVWDDEWLQQIVQKFRQD